MPRNWNICSYDVLWWFQQVVLRNIMPRSLCLGNGIPVHRLPDLSLGRRPAISSYVWYSLHMCAIRRPNRESNTSKKIRIVWNFKSVCSNHVSSYDSHKRNTDGETPYSLFVATLTMQNSKDYFIVSGDRTGDRRDY